MVNKKKIAILGGSFDPPHAAHYQLIKWLTQDFDQVLIMPNQVSPHKLDQKPIAFYHRFHLLKLMLRELDQYSNKKKIRNSKITLSNLEYKLPQPSFSWKTLQALRKICDHTNADFHWIIGFDQLIKLHKWSNIEYLAKNCHFTVFRRKVDASVHVKSRFLLRSSPAKNRLLPRKTQKMLTKLGIRYTIAQNELIDISSSEIRDFMLQKNLHSYAATNKEIAKLFGFSKEKLNVFEEKYSLTVKMIKYIKHKQLYQ